MYFSPLISSQWESVNINNCLNLYLHLMFMQRAGVEKVLDIDIN